MLIAGTATTGIFIMAVIMAVYIILTWGFGIGRCRMAVTRFGGETCSTISGTGIFINIIMISTQLLSRL